MNKEESRDDKERTNVEKLRTELVKSQEYLVLARANNSGQMDHRKHRPPLNGAISALNTATFCVMQYQQQRWGQAIKDQELRSLGN